MLEVHLFSIIPSKIDIVTFLGIFTCAFKAKDLDISPNHHIKEFSSVFVSH